MSEKVKIPGMRNVDDREGDLPEEMRVVDEAGEPEVVRLEPGDELRRKVKRTGEEVLLQNQRLGEEPEDLRSRELAWVEMEEEEKKAIPMGWFVLLGVGLLGVLGWAMFQGAGEEKVEALGAAGPGAGGMEEAEVHLARMEEVLREFLGAETVAERAKWVRNGEQMIPLMQDYYREREFDRHVYEKILTHDLAALYQHPFVVVKVSTEGGEELPILMEDLGNDFRVDWGATVSYNPVSISEYIERTPTDPVTLRVYAQVDNYFNYEFSDERQFRCFRLNFRGSEEELFGYVPRGTELEQKFAKVMPLANRPGQRALQPMILRVRFLENSRAPRSVLIEQLESGLWIFPKGADEVEAFLGKPTLETKS